MIENNPTTTQLLNATKVSGRTKKGTGIGIFNALTGSEFATIRDTVTGVGRRIKTAPLTNYSVLVVDQNLKNNSTVTVTNTNVLRDGETYDANVTGLTTNLYTRGQAYNFNANSSVTQLYYNDSTQLGHAFSAGVGKTSGQWRAGLGYDESSKTYNRNDLGYQTTNNLRNISASVSYNIFKPFWRLVRMWTGLSGNYQRFVRPDAFTYTGFNFTLGGTFRNFMTAGLNLGGTPYKPHDYFEPRVDGRYYEGDESYYANCFMSSNYGKPFAFDGGLNGTIYSANDRWVLGFSASPRIRMNDKVMLILSNSTTYANNEEGVAVGTNGIPFDGEDPVFSRRNRLTVINTVNANYTFTNRMGITFRLRHYWSKVEYNAFFALNEQGGFDPTDYTGYDAEDNSYHNNSYNAFTIDAAYRWVFAPGSELSFVWKNSIYSSSDEVALNYFRNLGTMAQNPATNSLSLKILYYFNYWNLHQKIFKRKEK